MDRGSVDNTPMDEDDLYRALGESVAARRRALRKTQAEVAATLGLSRASLANMERGRQKVLLHQVYRLAEALELGDVRKLLPIGAMPRGGPQGVGRGAPAAEQPENTVQIKEPESGLTARQRAQVEALFAKASPAKGGGS
jgi:transcriptional regulator with XRE-family HTH domain